VSAAGKAKARSARRRATEAADAHLLPMQCRFKAVFASNEDWTTDGER
jgi:hypothetical protein